MSQMEATPKREEDRPLTSEARKVEDEPEVADEVPFHIPRD